MQKTTLWCVQQNELWTFLPMPCCELLNKAASKNDDQLVTYGENYVYDVKNKKRMTFTSDNEKGPCEDIMCVEGILFLHFHYIYYNTANTA